MKFSFKKIGSVLASGAMLTSTVALAAAANFPAPYVSGGTADVALVYGSNAVATDLVAVTEITTFLQERLAAQTATGGSTAEASVTGEAYPLFTTGSPLLLNSTINAVRSTLTEDQLPTVLADGIFETTTNVDYTQRLNLGSTPRIEFKQQPSSEDNPQLGFSLSTTPSTGYIYNATVIFESNVNLTNADAVGETLNLFGSTFIIGGASTATKLVLLKSSEEISLTNTNPTAEVTVDEASYIVELVTASDTEAEIRVTDSNGNSDIKTIKEDTSKTVQGVEVTVKNADENNFQLSATVLLGSSRVTFQDGSAVKIGTDETAIEGTNVKFYHTNDSSVGDLGLLVGKIVVQVTADSSDKDAIFPGGEFVDPVFGSFKVDFSGITSPLDSTSDREIIEVKNSGNDKMTVKFESHDGSEAVSAFWAYNKTDSEAKTATLLNPGITAIDLADNDGDPIVVKELGAANRSQYVVLASDDEGGLYEVTAIRNSSTGFADDYVRLKNVFTSDELEFKATSEGTVTGATAQGKTYTITYFGDASSAEETRTIRVNMDESTGNNLILFPTIATNKGAKVMFYEPTRIVLDQAGNASTDPFNIAYNRTANFTGFLIQDGDGYGTITITAGDGYNVTFNGNYSFTFPGGSATSIDDSTAANRSVSGAIGKLTFNITQPIGGGGGSQDLFNNTAEVYLVSPAGGNIIRPALIIFEEKDDASNYEAMVVTLDGGYDGDSAGLGVSDVVRTWSSDATNEEVQLETNSDLYQEMDIWGSLITVDKSDSDQTTATISYPDEQVIASAYISEASATVSGGGSTGGSVSSLGSVVISDSEVSSVSNKNLIVVGGSCVNSVAATLLGVSSPTCGADFTAATSVGSGQYLIETFSRSSGKVATLVAGFNAGDTTNAAKRLTSGAAAIDTTVGKKYIDGVEVTVTS